MKILIVGAGRVGTSVAENLVSERNDITIIDVDSDCLFDLQNRLDLRGVVGDAISMSTLKQAGAEDTDMLIACTSKDAVNLVVCKVARSIFNVPRRVARLRNSDIASHAELLGEEGFCVDAVISPEESVTAYLQKLIEFPEALQVVALARGRISVITMRVSKAGFMANHKIADLQRTSPPLRVRVIDILRGGHGVPVSEDTVLLPGDEILLVADTEQAHETVHKLQKKERSVRRIMVAGGGNIGSRVAHNLALAGYNVRIIEHNLDRCEELASSLPGNVLVLHGNATDEDLLQREGIEETDTWLALTSEDEDNIMSSLLAKRLGARRVIALINRQAYGELMQGSLIDIAVSPSQVTMSELLKYVRQADIVAAHRLRNGNAEVLEMVAHGDIKSSRVVGRRVDEVDLPRGSSIGAIARAEEIIIPEADTRIESRDHVIVFVPSKAQIDKVEKLFQVSAAFF